MFYPLSLFIGLRYTRAKRKNHFISFISIVSMLGIALGVMVLIVVLSVMNGFDKEIKSRILDMVPQVTITGNSGQISNWQPLAASLPGHNHIVAVAPFIQGEAMLTGSMGSPAFGFLQGIDPATDVKVSPIADKMVQGKLTSLAPRSFNIILGQDLATSLGVYVGDKVVVYVPKASFSLVGVVPRLKQFTVTGIFKTGYQFDSSYALININDAAALLQMGNAVSGLQLKLDDLFNAESVSEVLNRVLPPSLNTFTWVNQNANFFQALAMEKIMMFFILVLIVAVAAFNMLASLVMLVTDKEAEIAILRTMGMPSKMILHIFVIQGMVIGLIGTFIGVVLGIIVSLNVTAWTNALQNLFNIQFLNSSVYYINFLPSSLHVSDVLVISAIAILLSFLATLYPAYRASKINPAEALRYE
jgi:lipoprotein-releasing system permease protein